MLIAVAVLLVAICLGAVGQIFLKDGINRLGEKPAPLVVLASIATPMVAIGFICYGVSSLLYLLALSRLELSYAYPMVAVSYVMVTVLSYWRFHDVPPPLRILGLGFILLGVIIVAVSYRHPPSTVVHTAAAGIERPADAGQ